MSAQRTARDAILARLLEAGKPLAGFELQIWGVSENAACTRLSEMARDGLVVGTLRPGKRFKEWAPIVKPGQQELPLA